MIKDSKEIAMSKGFVRSIMVLALLVSSTACSTFTLLDQNFKPRGKAIAVIAGLENKENLEVAYYMTEALKKNSRFQVISQKHIAQTLANYPSKIQGPFKTAYFEIETDYGKSDVKKIRAIQQKLGADYVYVVWTPSATVYNEKIHQLHAVGQMFEGPNSKEVGNGRFDATAGKTDCCLVPAPGDADKTNAIKDTTEYVAKEIAEKTHMQKR